MALSTRATLAAIGGALAIGALGVTGVAYAQESGTTTPSYVTTVDDGTASTAPPAGSGTGSREDCPDKGGTGSGSGERSGTPSTPASPESTTSGADA